MTSVFTSPFVPRMEVSWVMVEEMHSRPSIGPHSLPDLKNKIIIKYSWTLLFSILISWMPWICWSEVKVTTTVSLICILNPLPLIIRYHEVFTPSHRVRDNLKYFLRVISFNKLILICKETFFILIIQSHGCIKFRIRLQVTSFLFLLLHQ